MADLLTADGLCAIDISLKPSAPYAHTSGVQLYTAAYVLINTCAAGSPSQGGVAVDIGKPCHGIQNLVSILRADFIGGDNNLVVSLTSYQPKVQCVESRSGYPRRGDCYTLLNKMDVSARTIVFGDANNPDVDVRTPYAVAERKAPATGLSAVLNLRLTSSLQPNVSHVSKVPTRSWQLRLCLRYISH